MARKTKDEAQIARLIERIEASRRQVATAACDLRERFDVKARLRDSLRDSLRGHPNLWFGTSAAAGLWLATKLFGRRRAPATAAPAKRGLGTIAAAAAASALQTLLRDWLLRESRKRLEGIAPR